MDTTAHRPGRLTAACAALALTLTVLAGLSAAAQPAGATEREFSLTPSCSSWPTITDDGALTIRNRSAELNGDAGSTQHLQVWTNNRIVFNDHLAPGQATPPLAANDGTFLMWAGEWYRLQTVLRGCTQATTTTTGPTTTTTEGTTTTTGATTSTTEATTTTTESTTTTSEATTTTAAETTTTQATPPTIPPTADLDCLGGTGDGPYVDQAQAQAMLNASTALNQLDPTRYQRDPHGLDSDSDGIACEPTDVEVLTASVGPIDRLPNTGGRDTRTTTLAGLALIAAGTPAVAWAGKRRRTT